MMQIYDLIVIGAGPAGYFAALSAADQNPDLKILILEKGNQVLSKVLVSGGGRCNLTHACYDPKELIGYYPRGSKELLGAFTKFQPADIIEWFEQRGVKTKTEKDGRVFPISDLSKTIANCLVNEADKAHIEIYNNCHVKTVKFLENKFTVRISDESNFYSKHLLIATGGNSKNAYEISENFGHTVIPPVPSLFSFNIKDQRLAELQGISVPNVELSIRFKSDKNQRSRPIKSLGPLLITHWGISGPAVLKLSALAARSLYEKDYQSKLLINWLPSLSKNEIYTILLKNKGNYPKQIVSKQTINGSLPSRLWVKIIISAGIDIGKKWTEISNQILQRLAEELNSSQFNIQGKGIFKEEFVTCGGIKLSEINFKTMESKILPRLYFAGEVLDIDGLTGGFNFQSAWTTGWIAGQSIGQNLNQ